MEKLENQIRKTFKKAMIDSLENIALKTESLSNDDIDWIVKLCDEIKTRIKRLIPSRHDMHKQFDTEMDIVLIRQMLKNDAFDGSDLNDLVNMIFSRLGSLCAPAQDEDVATKKSTILAQPFGKKVAMLILYSNEVLDEIERLGNLVRRNSSKN
jgi:hypothetical protein